MRKAFAIFFLFLALLAAAPAWARGGQAADDCPPGSTDPDCAASASSGSGTDQSAPPAQHSGDTGQ